MVRIAIVEDDAHYARVLRRYLEQYSAERKIPIHIDVYGDGDQIVEQFQAQYDILLIDIVLPLLDGMSAAREIRGRDQEVEIVFITNSPQYAIQGYRVGALDYLLKPTNYFAFSEVLTRAIARRGRNENRYLLVNVKGGKRKLEIRRIRYVEVQDHDLIFHTLDGNFSSKGTIRAVIQQLQDQDFFLCNRGYLVNLAYVDGVSSQDVQIGEDILPMGRTRKKAFMDALNLYLNQTPQAQGPGEPQGED